MTAARGYYLHGCAVLPDGRRDSFWTRFHESLEDALEDAGQCIGSRMHSGHRAALTRGSAIERAGTRLELQAVRVMTAPREVRPVRRIVRTGDGYRRESIDQADTLEQARYLLREYRLADPAGYYESIAWRPRADD